MNIAIGSDHRGFACKEYIKKHLVYDHGPIMWRDVGAKNDDRSDYPSFAYGVVEEIRNHTAAYGILLCGTGTGMAIAANRFEFIYAGVVWNEQIAQQSREDDNVNVLVLPSNFITHQQAVLCVRAWIHASFKGERYQERIDMIDGFTKR